MRTTVLVVSLLGLVVVGQATSVSSTAKPSSSVPPLAEELDDESRLEEPVADGRSAVRTLGRETAHKPTDHDVLMKNKKQGEQKASTTPSAASTLDKAKETSNVQQSGSSSQTAATGPAQHSQAADIVPNRYSNVVETPFTEDESQSGKKFSPGDLAVRSTSVKVRGASRQFGSSPLVEPFRPELLLNDKQRHKTYENYKVYRVNVDSRKQEQYLASLENDLSKNVTLWEDPIVDRNVTLIVPPQSVKSLEQEFAGRTLKYDVLTENLKHWLDDEMKGVNPNLFLEQKYLENFKLDTYHTFDELSSYIDLLVSQFPNLVTAKELGRTYEGNPIRGVVLSTGGQKRAIYIDAGTHAREWISVASLIYVLSSIVTKGASDPELRSFLENYEFHFVPVVNPDGYKYTWAGDRLWRKNRVRFQGYYWCQGVDPNRNYDYYWGGEGASANPCSDTYRGSAAFSEQETQAVRDYINGIKHRLSLYLSLHAYGQYLLLPYGTGPSMISAENNVQMAAAGAFRDAIYSKTGLVYKIGSSKQILYAASGLSNDWVHSQGVTHAYVAELRDSGTHGFILPQKQILPAAEEIFEGIRALIRYIAANDLKTQSKTIS